MKNNNLKKRKPRVLIKIGGSLIRKGLRTILKLNQDLVMLSREYKIIIVPGGGEAADVVRELYKRYNLSQEAAHWMAILAMDINATLLASTHSRLRAADSTAQCNKLLRLDYIPVLLPFKLLKNNDQLPHTWKVTSDSIALFMSKILKTDFAILLKDVDGIYQNGDELINHLDAAKLKTSPQKCVDRYLYKLLPAIKKNLYICSGLYPKRIKKILTHAPAKFTKIFYRD